MCKYYYKKDLMNTAAIIITITPDICQLKNPVKFIYAIIIPYDKNTILINHAIVIVNKTISKLKLTPNNKTSPNPIC